MDELEPVTTSQDAAPEEIEEARRNASYGSLIGIALLAAILAVGAFYVWQGQDGTGDVEPEAGVRGGEPVPDLEGSAQDELVDDSEDDADLREDSAPDTDPGEGSGGLQPQ